MRIQAVDRRSRYPMSEWQILDILLITTDNMLWCGEQTDSTLFNTHYICPVTGLLFPVKGTLKPEASAPSCCQ